MKVAINTDWGGFGLSKEAYRELGLEWDGFGYAYHDKDKRTDPKLIEVIERLGPRASGDLSAVAVVNIPDGMAWELEDYDGIESVHESHCVWR